MTDQAVISDLNVRVSHQDERINDHGIRIALLEKSTETINAGLKAINDGVWKLIWIAIAGFALAIVGFITSGGLVVGG